MILPYKCISGQLSLKDVISCSTSQNREFVEIPNGGHVSLFESLIKRGIQ